MKKNEKNKALLEGHDEQLGLLGTQKVLQNVQVLDQALQTLLGGQEELQVVLGEPQDKNRFRYETRLFRPN